MSWLPTSRVHCPFVARLHTWNTCARLALTLRPIHIVECKLEGQVTESQDLGNLFCNGETHPFITPLLSPHCLSVFQFILQTPVKLIPFTSPCHPSINQSIAVRTKKFICKQIGNFNKNSCAKLRSTIKSPPSAFGIPKPPSLSLSNCSPKWC